MNSSKLKDKQLNILRSLFRFRFLTSHQIQQLISDKSLRLTNYHLKTLHDLGFISRHFNRSLGQGNQPAVYFLAPKSIKTFEGTPGFEKDTLRRIYRERLRSQRFIDHSLLLTNCFIYLQNESQKTNHKLYFYSKTDLQTHPYMPQPLPDAYFARVDPQGVTKRYFVDIFDEGAPRFSLRQRVSQYVDYFNEGTFENVTGHPFPKILLICPDEKVKKYLNKHIIRVLEEEAKDEISFFLTTKEAVLNTKLSINVWQKVEEVWE